MSELALECPICMDAIEGLSNKVVTECGHTFHCSCLMQNAAHNGFGCPYCRASMAKQVKEENDEESEGSDDGTVFEEEALTSFRMFHRRLNNEEVENEQVENEQGNVMVAGSEDDVLTSFRWFHIQQYNCGEDELPDLIDENGFTVEDEDEDEDDDSDSDSDSDSDDEEWVEERVPDSEYVAKKITEWGITTEDLVKSLLYQEHSNWGMHYSSYERRSSEIYGQFKAAMCHYHRNPPTPATSITN